MRILQAHRLATACAPTSARGSECDQIAIEERRQGPGAETVLDLRVELDPVAFAKDRIDLRVTYGATLYPEYRAEPLWRDRAIAVASPGFAARWLPDPGRIGDLPDAGFIHSHWGSDSATEPSWANFMVAARIARLPDPMRGLHVDLTGLAIAAAEALVTLAPDSASAWYLLGSMIFKPSEMISGSD